MCVHYKNIEIKLVDAWPEDEIVELYKAGGWWKDSYDPSGIKPLINGSYAFAVAINTKKLNMPKYMLMPLKCSCSLPIVLNIMVWFEHV